MHSFHRGPALLMITLIATASLTAPIAHAQRRPHAGMMRYPDVSKTHIVFVYAEDLWVVSRAGGMAVPLASPPGGESFPRFSPDGQTVAFVGNYDGNRDLYTIPVAGGAATRVTHHPDREFLYEWTPDGRLIFASTGFSGMDRKFQLLAVPATGGLPEQLPVPYGIFGTISADGTWLAYTPYTRDFATWKRYRGGNASDIWLFNLRDHTSKQITDWEGTDSQPMWHGDNVYYMSDAGAAHRLNIWVCDTRTGERRQISSFKDFDVKWPAIGPGPTGRGEIVFQNGTELYLLDLATEIARAVAVTVPGDLPNIRPQRLDVGDQITTGSISATGKRAVIETRGDIWTVPARKGFPRNLSRTSGVAERDPSWSPDGRWIAYFSDQTGEYELYIKQSDGQGQARQLTFDGSHFRRDPNWSPDSKRILFADKTGALYLHTIGEDDAEGQKRSGETVLIDTNPNGRPLRASWSHDSNWIAYARDGENYQTSIWLYSLPTKEKRQVTSGMFNDTWPTFDRKGQYFFFASNRRFSRPTRDDIGDSFVYTDTDTLVVVPLRDEVGSPWAPESDEETWEEDDKGKEEKPEGQEEEADEAGESDTKGTGDEEGDADQQPKPDENAGEADDGEPATQPESADKEQPEQESADEEEEEAEEEVLEIELDGFEQRAISLPVKPGAFYSLAVNSDGKLIYVRAGQRGGNGPSIKIFDLKDEKKKEKTVVDGAFGFDMSADGKKLLVVKGPTWAVVDAQANQKLDKPIPKDGLEVVVNPREEWRQLFLEAWRLQRDYFYVANLHGVDWPAMRDHYIKMLDDCVSRADVGFVIGELIAELNIGHAYYFGDDEGSKAKAVPVGMLGADFELHDGAYRIKRIIEGGPWDFDARGPLSQPGVPIREGDYLLAINGVPLDTSQDPWAAFQGQRAGRVVALTVSDQPVLGPESKKSKKGDKDKDKNKGSKKNGKSKDNDKNKSAKETDQTAEDETEDPFAGQREVLVELISNRKDGYLRYRAWVEKNRAWVEEKSGGQVGYVHVPDTGTNGQNELFRQFYGQRHKAALIIDDRWNGGGQIPTRFVELLNRPVVNYWRQRDGRDTVEPADAHHGPKCMLINGLAGSGGDAFPYYFRQAGLGQLVGMRTWGGLVGISGNPQLIDGTFVSVPRFGFYETDGTWGVEGHGVDPDIEVIDDPSRMVDGGDPQLDAAIQLMLDDIKRNPYTPPPPPKDPDRSGMGVQERDK